MNAGRQISIVVQWWNHCAIALPTTILAEYSKARNGDGRAGRHTLPGPSMLRSLPANLVRPPKPASPRRTGSGGNTGNALAVPRGQARQSGEPAFATPLCFSDTPYPQLAVVNRCQINAPTLV